MGGSSSFRLWSERKTDSWRIRSKRSFPHLAHISSSFHNHIFGIVNSSLWRREVEVYVLLASTTLLTPRAAFSTKPLAAEVISTKVLFNSDGHFSLFDSSTSRGACFTSNRTVALLDLNNQWCSSVVWRSGCDASRSLFCPWLQWHFSDDRSDWAARSYTNKSYSAPFPYRGRYRLDHVTPMLLA